MDFEPGAPDPGPSDGGVSRPRREDGDPGVPIGADPVIGGPLGDTFSLADLDSACGASDEDGPHFALLPPEDRLWRHPSERIPPAAAMGRVPLGDGHSGGSRAFSALGAGWGRTWTVALVAGLVGALSVSVIAVGVGWWGHPTTVVRSVLPAAPSVSLASDGQSAPADWTAVDDSVAASVVSITVAGSSGPRQGSGVVILGDGAGRVFVITDRSLFDPSDRNGYGDGISVQFLSGATAAGRLVGQDAVTGVAVIDVPDAGRVAPAPTGTVADLRQADPVLAVGSRTDSALSTGAVSGEDRSVDLTDGTDMENLIAVTMPALNPAAFGGPLLDQYGRVVGMTVGIDPADNNDESLTFAVPIDEATRVATDLIDGRRPAHAWMGVDDAADLPSQTARQMGVAGGVQVGMVEAGSPAARAGLHTSDIITEFDGRPLETTGQLVAQMAACVPGHVAPVTYVHGGHTRRTTVRLGAESGTG